MLPSPAELPAHDSSAGAPSTGFLLIVQRHSGCPIAIQLVCRMARDFPPVTKLPASTKPASQIQQIGVLASLPTQQGQSGELQMKFSSSSVMLMVMSK